MSDGVRNPRGSERRVRELAGTQFGVISAEQAVAAGMSRAAISRRVRDGLWERRLPGVYRIAGVPESDRQVAIAAALWAGEGALVSHGSAGVLWGIDGVRGPKTELWVPAPRNPRARDCDRPSRLTGGPSRSNHARSDPHHDAGTDPDRRRRSPRGRPSPRGDGECLPGEPRYARAPLGSTGRLAKLGSSGSRTTRGAARAARRRPSARIEARGQGLAAPEPVPTSAARSVSTGSQPRAAVTGWTSRGLIASSGSSATAGRRTARGRRSGKTASGCRRWWRRDGGCCSSRGTSEPASLSAWFVGSRWHSPPDSLPRQ